jgi:hypothetical protein
MYNEVRSSQFQGWDRADLWKGPESEGWYGIGILRKWGSLEFTAATRNDIRPIMRKHGWTTYVRTSEPLILLLRTGLLSVVSWLLWLGPCVATPI